MPSFLDLPLENIVEALCLHCTPRLTCINRATCGIDGDDSLIRNSCHAAALAALARTSKQLRAIATPRLYHRPYCGNWVLLARTLIQHPDLASHVKDLTNITWDYRLDAESHPDYGIVLSAYERAVQARDARAESDPHVVLPEDLELGEGDNKFDFFVTLCPRLVEINAEVGGDCFTLSEDRSLKYLKQVDLQYSDTELGWSLCSIEPLAWLAPEMSRIRCSAIWDASDFQQVFYNVTTLSLVHSSFNAVDLGNILRGFPNLETFKYEAGDATVSEEAQFSAREAQDVILRDAPGLKSLGMILQYMFSVEDYLGSDMMWTSFAGMTKLEHLTFDQRCLLPHPDPHSGRSINGQRVTYPPHVPSDMVLVDLLPRSIRSVDLWNASYGTKLDLLKPAIEKLAAVAADKFPFLSQVTLSGEDWDGAGSIQSALEQHGIRCVRGTDYDF